MTIPKQQVFPSILEDKEQEAIAFVKKAAKKAAKDGEILVLGMSGGKDSVTTHDIAERAGVSFKAHYCNTTIDPSAVHKFIRKHYPEVKWLRSKKSFWQWIMHFGRKAPMGLPTRLNRWCCRKLKEEPAKNEGTHLLVGTRAEESSKRAKRGRINERKSTKQIIYAPIFNWSTQDVWNYIRKYDLPYLSLYENQGCRRVGCVVCPQQGKIDKLRSQRDFPRFWKLLKLYCNKLYDKYSATVDWVGPFENGDDLYEWWLSDMSTKKWLERKEKAE